MGGMVSPLKRGEIVYPYCWGVGYGKARILTRILLIPYLPVDDNSYTLVIESHATTNRE